MRGRNDINIILSMLILFDKKVTSLMVNVFVCSRQGKGQEALGTIRPSKMRPTFPMSHADARMLQAL